MVGNVWWSVRAKDRMRDGARKMEKYRAKCIPEAGTVHAFFT